MVEGKKLIETGARSFRALIRRDYIDLVMTYRRCTIGLDGVRWPDGGSLLDQPVKLVAAFGVIGGVLARYEQKGK